MSVDIYSKAYNRLLDDFGIDPDKYEREDAFMSAMSDIDKGVNPGDAFATVFDLVHGFDISPDYAKDLIMEVKNGK